MGFVVAELGRGASDGNRDSITDKTRHINPLLETLQDDFNDASINTAKWSDNSSVTEGGGTFNFNLDSNSSEIYSRNSYDLRGSSFVLKATFDRLQNSVDSLFSVRHNTPVERQIYFSIFDFGHGNRISFGHYNGSFNALGEIAYDATAHRWLRLRESAGTVFWDTAPDGVVWTNRHSEPVTTFSTMDLGAVRAYLMGADWIADPNGFKLRIDDYNFHPREVTRPRMGSHNAGGVAPRQHRAGVPGVRARRSLSELGNLRPDLQAPRLAADVRHPHKTLTKALRHEGLVGRDDLPDRGQGVKRI